VQVGDAVKMEPMWKYEVAIGTVIQVKKDGYIVVRWEGINGDWHYTPEQAEKLQKIE